MKKLNDIQAVFIVIASAMALLFAAFHKVILQPNTYIFAPMGGDALKNYFTLGHYVK